MAVTADKVVVELELKDGQYLAKVRQNEAVFTKAQRSTARSAEDAERRIRASSSSIASSLRSVAGVLATGATATAIMRLADGYTRLQNSLKVVGLEGSGLLSIQDKLYEVANRNGVAVGDLGQLYSRVALNNQALGASQSQLITVTEAAAAALKVQGLSATAARGPLLQLAQTLGSDIARAEEYNSVIEGIPVLAQAVASGLGVTTAELGKLVRDGKVTTEAYFQALLKGSDALIAQSKKVELTIGGSFEVLNNELGRYVGQTDASLSATQRLSAGIIGLANNLNVVVPALAVIAGIFATRYVAGLAAAALAEDGFITKARQATAEAVNNERVKTAAVAAGTRARTAALTAESIALRAQVDTGRNAAGQFISQAAAQQRLTATNRSLAASIGPATLATIKNTGAVTAATTGARALGSGLVSLAGGPIGVAILAVSALAAGIVYLSNKYGEFNVRQREQEATTKQTRDALDKYRDAAEKAAVATGKNATAAKANAEAMRLEALAALRSAEALRIRRLALLAEAQVTAKKEADDIRRSVGPGQTTLNQGQYATAILREQQAKKQYDEAAADTAKAERDFKQLEADIRDGRLAPSTIAASPVVTAAKTATSAAKSDADDAAKELAESLARIQESLLSDAERAAKELAEKAAIIAQAVSGGLITGAEGARLNAGIAGQGLEPFAAREPLQPLGNEGAEIGKMIAEGAAAQVESWRGVARDFVDVLASDNIWEAAGHKFRDAAFNQLEDLLTTAFASLSKGAFNTGGNFLGTLFGGNRASGGNVRAGMSYNVGEGGTERFVAPSNGYIIPNMKNAGASPGMSGMVRIQIGEGEMFSARVTEIAGPLSVQTAMTGVAYSQDQMTTATKRRGQSFI